MKSIPTLYFLCLGFYCVFCAPTAEKSLYDVIVEKCPSVHLLASYKDQHIFKVCKNWKVISEVDKLTENNRKEILCLLYFQSFTEYCTITQTPNVSVSRDVLTDYTLDMICDSLKTIPHKNLSNIFATKDNCKKICTDDMEFVHPVCSISFYFAHATPAPVPIGKIEKPSQQVVSDSNHPAGPAAAKGETGESKLLQPVAHFIKVNPNVPLANKMESQDESKLYPSKELKNKSNAAVPGNPDAAPKAPDAPSADKQMVPAGKADVAQKAPDAPPADKEKVPAIEADAAQKGLDTPPADKLKVPASEAEVHPDKSQKKADTKPNQANDDNKPETANNAVKPDNSGPENKVKLGSKAVDAKVESQGNKEESKPALHEALETDNQDIVRDQQEQDKGDQQLVNPELDNTDVDAQPSDGLDDDNVGAVVKATHGEKSSKPLKIEDSEPVSYTTDMEGDSYFFTYFMLLCIIFIVGYVCYHNKQKILALILEGRKGKRQYRGRRPNSANYHKLDSNLEEAITSSCKKNTTNVIY